VPRSTLRTRRHRALVSILVQLRKEKGLSQAALAKKLKVPQSYIAQIENFVRRLDVVEFIELVEDGLDEDPQEILGRVRAL
jgi:transcriptional regulator with XRE-family HTH domain